MQLDRHCTIFQAYRPFLLQLALKEYTAAQHTAPSNHPHNHLHVQVDDVHRSTILPIHGKLQVGCQCHRSFWQYQIQR